MTDASPYARRGLLVRLLYLAAAASYWLIARSGGRRAGTVVLCYHAVRAGELRRFAWQMRHVRGRAASTAALPDSAAGTEKGAPRVCVTFDDGYRCVLELALPLMQRLGVPASIFVVPGRLGAPPAWAMPADYPDCDQFVASGREVAHAVHRDCCLVGSHTLSHAELPGLSQSRLRYELQISKTVLECLVEAPVLDLAFPYGAYDDECVSAALAAGYRRLFTLEPQVWRGRGDRGLVGRFLVSPRMWRLEFALTCAGAYAWLADWRRTWRRLKAWMAGEQPAPQEARAA